MDYTTVIVVLFLSALIIIMLLPNPKKSGKKVSRYRDTTIEVVNGKFTEIDKRRWDAEIYR